MGVREDILSSEDDSSALAILRAGIENRREFAWPGKSATRAAVRLLSAKEVTAAKFANQREYKAMGIDIAVHNIADYKEQEADHVLWRAIIDLDGKKVFSSVDDFRGGCSREVIAALSEEYNALSEECDPSIDAMSDAEYRSLLELVKKKPELIHTKVSNLRTAWQLLRTLADQQVS